MSGPIDKIPPLLARLGSDSEGERLACLRQLDRMLARLGMSWTDLARRLEEGPRPFVHIRTHERYSGPQEAKADAVDWSAALRRIIGHPDWRPTERERTFVTNMVPIARRFQPTEKQAQWIRDILDRLGCRP